jgi:hypothetical protein
VVFGDKSLYSPDLDCTYITGTYMAVWGNNKFRREKQARVFDAQVGQSLP